MASGSYSIPRKTITSFARRLAAENLPSATDCDVAARVCIQLADACERTMPWWEKMFFTVSHVRDTGLKCAQMAIRLRSLEKESEEI